jgi:hypothetical protein
VPGEPPRPPREYRPDLRPMILLGVLLVAVVIGWLLLSPILLPAAR